MQISNTEIFHNNSLLKRSGSIQEFSETDLKELVHCCEDPIYFIKNFVYIVNLDKGMIKFELYPYQEDWIRACHANRFTIFATARQVGKCVCGDTTIRISDPTKSISRRRFADFFIELKSANDVIVRKTPSEPKFIEEIQIKGTGWQVETPNGFFPIKSVLKTVPYQVYEIVFDDGTILRTADNHILIRTDFSEVFTRDLVPGDQILSEKGSCRVVRVTKTSESEPMYDLELGGHYHWYLTNGIVSHNTTTIASYLLWMAMFNPNCRIAILANKAATARGILGKIQLMIENLPFWLKPGIKVWNKGSIEIGNNSSIFCSATSSSSIRGESISVLYLDEMAFIQNDEEFFTSTFPVVSSGSNSKVIITSTFNGMNLFYRLHSDAEKGRNQFVPFRVLWNQHPERDEAWKQTMLKTMTERSFAVEHCCVGGDSLIRYQTDDGLILSKSIEDLYSELSENQENTNENLRCGC